MLDSLSWSLVDPISVPKLLVWLFRFFRAFERGDLASFLRKVVNYHLSQLMSVHITKELGLI